MSPWFKLQGEVTPSSAVRSRLVALPPEMSEKCSEGDATAGGYRTAVPCDGGKQDAQVLMKTGLPRIAKNDSGIQTSTTQCAWRK